MKKNIKSKFHGLNDHRYADNPLEKAFALEWQKENSQTRPSFSYLMDEKNRAEPDPPLTDRDWLVAATVVQWLGSPVGQLFLKDVIFSEAGKFLLSDIVEDANRRTQNKR